MYDKNEQQAPGPRPTTGAAQIAAQLRHDILNGVYAFDERLPAERELAAHFDASRGTVRSALQRLQDMSFVTRRLGSGTYVSYREELDDIRSVVNITSPLELIEARLAVEPHMARLAVLNASPADLERMEAALAEVETTLDGPDQFSEADERFHLALAEGAGNPLLLWIYRRINDIRHQSQWRSRKDRVLTTQHITEYNQQHRELFTAISNRDVQRAVNTLNGHLEKARRHLMGLGA
jgi:DNA-binding FadR family transcriptional regulator